MTRMIWDTLTLLVSGLMLGAWLHARFGKPIVEGGLWDVAVGLVLLTAVLGRFLQAIGAWPLFADVLGTLPLVIVAIAAVISLFTTGRDAGSGRDS